MSHASCSFAGVCTALRLTYARTNSRVTHECVTSHVKSHVSLEHQYVYTKTLTQKTVAHTQTHLKACYQAD